MPIRKPGGKWARNNQEKADLHAGHLESIFQPNESHDNQMAELNCLTIVPPKDISIVHISSKEIIREVNCLKMKKASGFDFITVRMLKELPQRYHEKKTSF